MTRATIARRRAVRVVAALLLAAPLVVAVPGCHDSEAPIKGRNDSFDRPWLTLGSTGLRADTLVQDARPSRDANGILTVAVPIRNVTDLALHVEYRYFFMDDRGMQVNAYPGRVTIPPRQTREVVGNASGPQAKDFRLELSYPRVN